MFFIEKKRSGCTGKTSDINKYKQTCVQSAFYLESHQACDRSQAFPMRAKCDRLQSFFAKEFLRLESVSCAERFDKEVFVENLLFKGSLY